MGENIVELTHAIQENSSTIFQSSLGSDDNNEDEEHGDEGDEDDGEVQVDEDTIDRLAEAADDSPEVEAGLLELRHLCM